MSAMRCLNKQEGMFMHTRDSRGFTLIEMLVVIAVIGIVAAMLVATLGGARWRAWDAQCKSNLKQLHTAAMNYMYDTHYGEKRLPYAYGWEDYWYPSKRWHERRGWVNWLNYVEHDDDDGSDPQPGDPPPWNGEDAYTSITDGHMWEYTGPSIKIYMCPAFKRLDIVADQPKPHYRSYVMNRKASGIALQHLKNASKLLLFADMHPAATEQVEKETDPPQDPPQMETVCERGLLDSTSRTITNTHERGVSLEDFGYDQTLDGEDAGGNPYEAVGSFHNGRGNAIFADGHIEKMMWTNTVDACSGNR